MNRGRVQYQNISTDVNELDSTKMLLSESSTRYGILHKYEPEDPILDPSHYLISLKIVMIGRILINNPTPLLTMKS